MGRFGFVWACVGSCGLVWEDCACACLCVLVRVSVRVSVRRAPVAMSDPDLPPAPPPEGAVVAFLLGGGPPPYPPSPSSPSPPPPPSRPLSRPPPRLPLSPPPLASPRSAEEKQRLAALAWYLQQVPREERQRVAQTLEGVEPHLWPSLPDSSYSSPSPSPIPPARPPVRAFLVEWRSPRRFVRTTFVRPSPSLSRSPIARRGFRLRSRSRLRRLRRLGLRSPSRPRSPLLLRPRPRSRSPLLLRPRPRSRSRSPFFWTAIRVQVRGESRLI